MSFLLNPFGSFGGGGGAGYSAPPYTTNLVVDLAAEIETYSDSAGTTPQTADDGEVANWGDQSGASHDATHTGSPANQAQLKLSIVNSKPVLRFSKSRTTTLGIADHADVEMDTDSTVILVMKCRSLNGESYNGILAKPNAYFFALDSAGKPVIDRPFIEAGVAGTNAIGTSAFRVVSAVISGTSVSHFLDGAANGTDTLTTGTANSNQLVIGMFSGSFFGNLDIARLLIYKAAVPTGNRESVEDFLGSVYSISISH